MSASRSRLLVAGPRGPLDALYLHLTDVRDRLRRGGDVADPGATCLERERLRADAHAELARRGLAAWSADVDRAVRAAEKAERAAAKFTLGLRDGRPILARLNAALDVLGSRAQTVREMGAPAPPAAKIRRGPPARSRRCRLKLAGDKILLDGEAVRFDLTANAAQRARCFLRHVIRADGNWISGPEMDEEERQLQGQGLAGTKWDRVKSRLPKHVAALVQGRTGAGYRLRPTAWRK
jgi:hypothetical protein